MPAPRKTTATDRIESVTRGPRAPQDHKTKVDAEVFTFTADMYDEDAGKVVTKTFELPSPTAALDRVSGRALRDASVGGNEGQMRLGYLLLESLDLPDGALDALYDKPAPESLGIIEAWLMSADKSGATLPKH